MQRILLGLFALALSGACAFAADHNDSPAVRSDPSADINDYYVFVNPDDAQELVAIMTINPMASGASRFSDAVIYDFLFDNGSGQVAIQCRFSLEQRVTCTAPGDRSVSGPLNRINVSGDFRVWAGLTDDPFFFDGPAFNQTVATGEVAFTDPGVDAFAGLNVLAIVVGISTDALSSGGASPVHQTWVASARAGGTGITADLDGFWWDSANSGRGWHFAVIGEDTLAATLFDYDVDGSQIWLQGTGAIEGNGAVLEMREFGGGFWATPLPAGTITSAVHGVATVEFTGCLSGSVEYDTVGFFATLYADTSFELNNRPAVDAAACAFFADTGQQDVFGKVHQQFQKDREGRPAINTALIPTGQKDAYNMASDPSQWVAQFADEMTASLQFVDGLDGVQGNLLLGDAATLAGVLADDRLVVHLGVPDCGDYLAVELTPSGQTPAACGGRTLAADVIDATLSAAVGSAVSDGVDGNDRAFQDQFPFLATPN